MCYDHDKLINNLQIFNISLQIVKYHILKPKKKKKKKKKKKTIHENKPVKQLWSQYIQLHKTCSKPITRSEITINTDLQVGNLYLSQGDSQNGNQYG
jgi:hypothetical protein